VKFLRSVLTVAVLMLASSAWAYQVTGPVLEVSDSKIVVQKGKEKWEIARTPDTKVNGDLKVGSKVTVEYTMAAKSVEVKTDKAKSKKK
jgi:cytochrome c1